MLLKLLIILFITFQYCQAQSPITINPDQFLDVDNLIVDATISKIGNDFYEIFYKSWEEPPNSPSFNMIISEKPYPGRGNLITIQLNEQQVFSRFITPRYDEIIEVAGLAVSSIQNYLASYNEIQQQLNGEDLIGSGIF